MRFLFFSYHFIDAIIWFFKNASYQISSFRQLWLKSHPGTVQDRSKNGLGRRAVGERSDGNEEENTAISVARAEFRDEKTRSSEVLLPDPRRGIADRRPSDRAARCRGTWSSHVQGSTEMQPRLQRVRIYLFLSMHIASRRQRRTICRCLS